MLSCMYVYLPTSPHAALSIHLLYFSPCCPVYPPTVLYFSPCCPVYPPTVFLTMLPCLKMSIHLLYFSPCCLVYLPYNHSSTRYSVYVHWYSVLYTTRSVFENRIRSIFQLSFFHILKKRDMSLQRLFVLLLSINNFLYDRG